MGTRLSRENLASGVLAGSSCHILYPPPTSQPMAENGGWHPFYRKWDGSPGRLRDVQDLLAS